MTYQNKKAVINGIELFAKYFEIESIVPIETTDEFLISTIKKVICTKDNIIILTRDSNIFVIDALTGKAKQSIGRKGNGPGESKSILDISFDTELDNVIVMNDYDKLLFFDLEGKFLYEERLSVYFENIVYDKGNVILYNELEGEGCYPYYIKIYNIKDKTWKEEGPHTKVDFGHRHYGRQMVKGKNIWFASPFGYQIGRLTDDYKIEYPYTLKPERTMTDDLAKLSISDFHSYYQKVSTDRIISGAGSIRETDNFLVFKTNIFHFIVVDKKTLTLEKFLVFDKNLGVVYPNYFPHEGNDDRIMLIVQPSEWMNRKNKGNASDYLQALVDTVKVPEKLQALIDSVKVNEDDNPILIFYKERKN
jgi:hypothetical protein